MNRRQFLALVSSAPLAATLAPMRAIGPVAAFPNAAELRYILNNWVLTTDAASPEDWPSLDDQCIDWVTVVRTDAGWKPEGA
jgi:hypothetical protein